ncbi:peptidoglycan-associated lipoprotein Pal [Pelagibius sp. Alg239-R121]|uniref:peptidoglycan-associated lipoprotein Pal n=1 Tax=Pelagibius sp. Alg239-R121 TaxID=2993448 RepID=UPI0024A6DAEC|nr:peptidoglycan-associated lipoprotein Pal [Pelagibius sp. Alg239-R121]
MRLKFLTLIAAAALLSACASDDETAATSGNSGQATAPTTEGTAPVQSTAIAGPTPGTQEHLTVNVGDRVFFDTDRSDLSADSREVLEKVAVWMNSYPVATVTVEGHADERGTREYNLALGERRANSVSDYLVALGVSPNRVQTVSFGKEQPAVLGSNEEAWAQNRRGVFKVN